MASAKENAPEAPQPLPRRTSSSSSPRPPPPLRPKMANGANEPPPVGVGGVLKCTCFRLPSRTKKPLPPPPAPPKLSSASRSRSAVAPDVSASLSTWWPSSPSAASAGAGAAATANPAPAGSGGSVLSPRRAASARSLSSSWVMPRSERKSFSFAVSPAASASSSCMSTPKIAQGWQQK